jgi:membrane protein implicated in regulation of membrane protease activity
MSLDDVASWAWVLWLALILIFLVIEIFTVDFTFLMMAVGSVGGLVAAALGVPWFLQLLIAGALSLVLIFSGRPPLQRLLRRGGQPSPSYVEALVGLTGAVSTKFVEGTGQVKLSNGETWTARAGSDRAGIDTVELSIGDRVTVIAIEGATAVIEPIEGNAA